MVSERKRQKAMRKTYREEHIGNGALSAGYKHSVKKRGSNLMIGAKQRSVLIGPKGGHYWVNHHGRKVYVKSSARSGIYA